MTQDQDSSLPVSDAAMEQVSGGGADSMMQALHKDRWKAATSSPVLSPLCPIAIAPDGSDLSQLSGK